MNNSQLIALHKKLWKPGSVAISAPEAIYIKDLILRHQPKLFLELGTAAGTSTLLIYRVLETIEHSKMVTVDLNAKFVGNQAKPTGYLIDEHLGHDPRLSRIVGYTSLDIDDIVTEPIDMCFIDAQHRQPWPILDTLFVWPHLARNGVMIHHDLRLYQKNADPVGIGPKYLFDQFPSEHRFSIAEGDRNIFHLTKTIEDDDFATRMADGLLLPWSLRGRLNFKLASRIQAKLAALYPPRVSESFAIAFDRFNGL